MTTRRTRAPTNLQNKTKVSEGTASDSGHQRPYIFISKATPLDDDFVLWLAPRLEAAGYEVFTDITCLKFGDHWRKILSDTLYEQSCKMLLCCKTETLQRNGVLSEIEIAKTLTRELNDPRFIVPICLERGYRPVFGITELQYVDFERSWADGLASLLAFLEEEGVPRREVARVNPEWESYRQRRSLSLQPEPEPLVSNWLRIAELPDNINYYVPTGAINLGAFQAKCRNASFPCQFHNRGILTFATFDELAEEFADHASLKLQSQTGTLEFGEHGFPDLGIESRDAHNVLISMMRQAWEKLCQQKGLVAYAYSSQTGFHAGDEQVAVGKKVPWGRQGENRSAMLRNVARGKVWSYGVTATPSLWPYPHFRLKSRVLFSELAGDKAAGPIIKSTDHQFRLRRTVCKGWRNKRWLGCLSAFLEVLSGDSAFITLPLSPSQEIKLVAEPIIFTSPVSTLLPDTANAEDEETDQSLLGGFHLPSDETEEGAADGTA